jgi:3-phosphoshikimate 1-carboxyvinyltransferase
MSERAVSPIDPPDARVRVPGSRSLTNRALVCAALADGPSRLSGTVDCDDTQAMVEGLQRLGVEVHTSPGGAEIEVEGRGGALAIPLHPLDCRASGTTMRFLTACAALVPGRVVLDGTPRMRERPIQDLADALGGLGVPVRTSVGCPPLTVQGGRLRGGRTAVDASQSSQYLSALLLVAPYASEPLDLLAAGLTSKPYIEMTLDVMTAFSVPVERREDGLFRIEPRHYRGRSFAVEPDASSAAYFFAAAAVTGGRICVEGLSPASSQADVRFVEVLERMGCRAERSNHAIAVRGPRYLHGIDVDMNAMPDGALALAVVACFAQGGTRIRNVGNLRIKESDRMRAMKTELEKLGARVTAGASDLEIDPPLHIRPARIDPSGDHRIAMSLAIAGLRAPGIVIEDAECVGKTFPDFFDRLSALG